MSGSIEPSLFNYMDEFSATIESGKIDRHDEFDPEGDIFTFCESFFEQFFGGLGCRISGFGRRAREDATELVERLRDASEANEANDHVRTVVVLYEEFCDLSDDARGGYAGSPSVDLLTFHSDYLIRLLDVAQAWAQQEAHNDLAWRIEASRDRYNSAIELSAWLTTPRRKRSVWSRLISRRRTSS